MSLPKYFKNEPSNVKKSQRQEKRVANDVGGEVQRGSGAKDFRKSDVKTVELLIEAKRTDKDSLSVKKEWLIKVNTEALAYKRVPALSIEFNDMPNLVPKDWIALPAKTVALLIECYRIAMADEE